MLLVVTALALVVTVPLAGGNLARLADIRVRAVWAVLLAAAIQVGITQIPGGSHWVHAALHIFSYVLDAYFLFANRRLAGVPIVALGAALNVAAITSNAGVMPASSSALRIAGIATRRLRQLCTPAHAHLAFLGDVIPVPGPWPIGNVLSVGDLIIFVGALVVLHHACASRLLPRVRRAAQADRLLVQNRYAGSVRNSIRSGDSATRSKISRVSSGRPACQISSPTCSRILPVSSSSTSRTSSGVTWRPSSSFRRDGSTARSECARSRRSRRPPSSS